ncbi:MAG: DUF58 domain-containing protein [Candidatus Omnitrophica bacterium]|nr:DUF58 domain-containing protein [Candidatus Omnitrophota bacterium]
MPTKRAIFVFCFSLLLLIGAWASNLVLLYFAFSACIGLIILSFIFSKFLLFNLEIQREMPPQAHEGELISVRIKLRSRFALLDQSMEIEDVFTAGGPNYKPKTIYLNGISKGKIQFAYQEFCYKRGCYKIGPFKAKIFDPLGLFYMQKEIYVYSSLVVYPSIFQVYNLPFILGHLAPRFGEQTTRISGNYEEFYGIREYQQEDGWRRIHWRSTARASELMVKHFEQSSQWKAMLVLDCCKANSVGFGKNNTFEYAIKIIASLTKYLMFKNASFGFLANTKTPLRINISKGKNHYYKILDKLAVIDSDGLINSHTLLAKYQWLLPNSSSLIIASNNFDQGLLKFLSYLKIQKNIGIIPIVLNSVSFAVDKPAKEIFSQKARQIKNVFNQISSQVYVINCNDDLKTHFMR